MLGNKITDPDGVEGGGEIEGLNLLPMETYLTGAKKRELSKGKFGVTNGIFSELSGCAYSGYEIHMGISNAIDNNLNQFTEDGPGYNSGNIYGTYIHGIFDEDGVADVIISALYKAKGLTYENKKISRMEFKESQYDKLADMIRSHMNMEYIYKIMGL